MYPRGAVHRFPAAAGRGRGGPTGVHYRDAGHAAAAAAAELKAVSPVHQLEGLPEVLHRDGDAGRHDSAKRGSVETRKAARSAGLARSRARPEGLRRRSVPGLYQTVPRVGAGVPNDAEQSAQASVAAPSVTQAAGRQERHAAGGDVGAVRDHWWFHTENVRVRQQEF